jgi:hypothetical protein
VLSILHKTKKKGLPTGCVSNRPSDGGKGIHSPMAEESGLWVVGLVLCVLYSLMSRCVREHLVFLL